MPEMVPTRAFPPLMPFTSHMTVLGVNETEAVNCFVVADSTEAFCGDTLIVRAGAASAVAALAAHIRSAAMSP